MQLDYVASTGAFTLRVERAQKELVTSLMSEHGFSFSETASDRNTAILFSKEPYAAVAFYKDATAAAKAQLQSIHERIEDSWRPVGHAKITCPMDKELWPFQVADVEYALRRSHSLVGDQPGCGKTPVAICYANEIRAKRILVLCPASIRLQWADRIREWSTLPWPYIVYPVLSGRHGIHPSASWTIVSYDLARTEAIGRALAQGRYDLLILDEAHYLKTVDSGRTRAVFGDHTGFCRNAKHENLFPAIASQAGTVMALTGTPIPNRAKEAYTLARHLCFDSIDWLSEEKFNERFNPVARLEGVRKDGSTYQYTREETGRAAELQARLRANFMVRHLKRDVMPQLRLPVYDLVHVEETKAVKQALAAESLLEIDPEIWDGTDNITVLGHIAAVRHAMGLAIAPQVADYAGVCLDGGEDKLVVFAWHTDVLDFLQQRLSRYGVQRIDGSTSVTQRKLRVKEFQENSKARIFLGQQLAAGIGTDGLQFAASHVLLAEPDWVPGQNMQAIDRLDRGGQTRTVQADIFVAMGSLLQKILASSLRKLQNTNAVLDRRATL